MIMFCFVFFLSFCLTDRQLQAETEKIKPLAACFNKDLNPLEPILQTQGHTRFPTVAPSMFIQKSQ
jgi:hypothetical protein